MQPKTQRQLSLFEDQRLDLEAAIQLSLMSLAEYGQRYRHWALAYSGGKDSSATVAFVAWAIKSGLVPAPASLSILYADTRQELPPLQQTAMRLLETLRGDGFNAQVVLPQLDDRYFVYMLGRGVPPPNNMTLRWCTPQIKVEPMHKALAGLRERAGQKLLMLTGVRIGESAARDQRIAVSCSKDSGECGQGWFQTSTPESIADTLAPLLHWRLCHVYDWLYFEQSRHGYNVSDIAAVYGDGDVRTGCIGCPLANEDTALKRLIKKPEWAHLSPLMELKPLYRELRKAKWRLRKAVEPEYLDEETDEYLHAGDYIEKYGTLPAYVVEKRKDGHYVKNPQRLGPLTMAARAYGLETVLDVQARAGVDLINPTEEARIRELWALNTWPQKWIGDEVTGDQAIDSMRLTTGGEIAVQALLIR